MKNTTASEILSKYQNSTIEEISNEMPAVLSAELIILSSKLWSAGSEILATERLMTAKWLEIRKDCETDKQAEQKIKLTDEYANWQKAKYAEKSVLSLIQSIKKLLRSKEEEYHNAY